MSEHQSLPFDLIEEVLSHVPRSDVATTTACSRVSKSFQDMMQKRLFEIIELEFSLVRYGPANAAQFTLVNVTGNTKAQHLAPVLTQSPRLASYVRVFRIISALRGASPPPPSPNNPTIVNILNSLSNLTSFSFDTQPHIALSDYFLFSEWLKNGISQLLFRNRNTLVTVSITAAKIFPSEILARLPKLEVLSILSLSPRPSTSLSGQIRPVHLRIQKSCEQDTDTLNDLVDLLQHDKSNGSPALVCFSRLAKLVLNSADATREITKSLINATYPDVLSHLQIRAPDGALARYNMKPWTHQNLQYQNTLDFDLSRLHNLTNLIITGELSAIPFAPNDNASTILDSHCLWIAAILSTLSSPSPNTVSRLSLKVQIHLVCGLALEDIPDLPLSPLIDVIREKLNNGALKDACVEFVVVDYHDNDENDDEDDEDEDDDILSDDEDDVDVLSDDEDDNVSIPSDDEDDNVSIPSDDEDDSQDQPEWHIEVEWLLMQHDAVTSSESCIDFKVTIVNEYD
ncbi:hypothetical protein CVT24_004394 [Panaeolus cyanescens]|uniref:F-box domain-containing protein n=1 Tax=Panaeolus cyanescens TaxID=181874 RepID=A0A409YBH4_9AGAR|nr:hypothetical protein CVT24_004394 [Panaeolus cyanescens]